MSLNKTCDKKSKTAEYKIQKILNKIESLKISDSYLSQLKLPEKEKKPNKKIGIHLKVYSSIGVVLIGIIVKWFYNEITSKTCLLEVPSSSKTLFRPPEDCSMCIDVDHVVRLANISAQEFEEHYAYSATPVIVTDATHDWAAIKEFNFKFFAEFYRNMKMGNQINDCFFFAYKSGLHSLQEVFDMDETRANLSGEPWYVGWSTCYSEESRMLRSYYRRPYFLPPTAESDMLDWVFMGGPGQGAHMHVDSVRHKSWQAQVRGRKQWQLAPPPECLYECISIAFTVEPGEIRQYHTDSMLQQWFNRGNLPMGAIQLLRVKCNS
ncbi:unnamed protein product [Diatraea saccharalis]|uniref:Cupin-like domain-containing protein n=1 Tax=Diatraea saccharalis TaxID=40085 RepID=A0A9N9WHJ8_9NEOP|nr:unnamed protein product [Diatraea saccharalis]